jgi:hypothetical protein
VVASLLFEAASRVIAAGGAPGCDAEKARGLRERAVAALDDAPATDGNGQGRDGSIPGEPPRPLLRRLPPPERVGPGRVATWAVGVTTAPRRQPTLDRCLDSLARAGWERPRLFIDGDVTLSPAASALPRTVRDDRVGAWPAYVLALHELLMREPRADAYLLVQDDALFYDREPLRAYLEDHVLWPGRGRGVVSLYCSKAYTHPSAGWHPMGDPWGWGALAFLFPNPLARAFLLDPQVFDHRWTGRSYGLAHIDVVIGRWAARRGVTIWYPSPSLVQHIGETSALWADSRVEGDRRASWFAGDPERGA